MFGEKKGKKNSEYQNLHSILCGNTNIIGDISSREDMRIDCQITGNIQCDGTTVIGSTGYIKGDIASLRVIVYGKIVGNIEVANLLLLKDTAYVEGEVKTQNIEVEPGAILRGNCVMNLNHNVDTEDNI